MEIWNGTIDHNCDKMCMSPSCSEESSKRRVRSLFENLRSSLYYLHPCSLHSRRTTVDGENLCWWLYVGSSSCKSEPHFEWPKDKLLIHMAVCILKWLSNFWIGDWMKAVGEPRYEHSVCTPGENLSIVCSQRFPKSRFEVTLSFQ